MAAHSHSHHEHHHAPHGHGPRAARHGGGRALQAAALLTLAFAVVEAAGGWWTGSLALVSDAGHMVTDAAALGLGALAAWLGRLPPSRRHSYGLGKAEIVAALLNAAAMLAIVAWLAYEAVLRLREPQPVEGGVAALIALGGLVLNAFVLQKLTPHAHDLNTRAARLHVIGDALGSIAALAAGVAIWATGWTRFDSLASLLIGVLIAVSAFRLLGESLHGLLEGVPHGLSVEAIGREMALVEGVKSVHDLHVWMLSGSRTALSAHVVVGSLGHWDRTLAALQQRLHDRFGIDHVTLQPESGTRPLLRHGARP
ncbi:MAG: cation diffusion facilitator family transporter [Clostridia bacterium]